MSHLYGCVNWNMFSFFVIKLNSRRTFTGAWIETMCIVNVYTTTQGRTFTGAWIETMDSVVTSNSILSHLYGCVNWNLCQYLLSLKVESHLYGCVNWNQLIGEQGAEQLESHLYGCVNWNSSINHVAIVLLASHLYGCVNWNCYVRVYLSNCTSRTFTGAWIETNEQFEIEKKIPCRTFTGAWIETHWKALLFSQYFSRTFTGAWIETVETLLKMLLM